MRSRIALLVASLALAASVLACGLLPAQEPVRIWTPAPLTQAPGWAATIRPVTSTATPAGAGRGAAPTPAATRTATARPSASPTPRGAAPTATATADPHLFVVTEDDISQAVSSGALSQSGVTIEGLAVRFADGKIQLSASNVRYGALQVQNLVLVGRLVVRDGVLHLETESISPRGLVTALIPTLADQALAQYAGQWYIEDVRILDGRLEIRIR